MAHDDFIPSDDYPEEFDTEYTDHIICPYCGYEFQDSWEFKDTQDEQHVDCHDCGEDDGWTIISVSLHVYENGNLSGEYLLVAGK